MFCVAVAMFFYRFMQAFFGMFEQTQHRLAVIAKGVRHAHDGWNVKPGDGTAGVVFENAGKFQQFPRFMPFAGEKLVFQIRAKFPS